MRSIFALALLGAIAFASTAEDEAEYLEFEALEEEFMAMANEDAMQDFADIAPNDPDSDQLKAATVNDMVEFAMFAARNNKAYTTADEFKAREVQWKKSQKKVDALNSKSKHAHFTVNYTADQTDEEFQRMLGLNLDDATNDRRMLLEDDRHRHLQDTDYYVNWIEEGKVSPVKEQGSCGSCWSFTGTLALESMQAIKDDAAPIRLSEQQGVDCTTNTDENEALFGETYNTWGCDGGWMNRYWNFSRAQGSMAYTDYEYTGVDGTCEHDATKIIARAGESGQITTSITDAKKQLQEGPMTIAVAAGNSCWRYYDSGVIDSTDRCPKWIDHAVVVVGLGNETYERTTTTPDRYSWKCKTMTSQEIIKKKCSSKTALKYRNRFCCEKTLVEEGKTTTETVNTDYWLIQNSWDTTWGDQGLIKLAVEGGYGVSGMNQLIEWVTVQDVDPAEE